MSTPRLSTAEYSDLVSDWNRRCRRGTVEPCVEHRWARVPHDHDEQPYLVCVYCMRTWKPDLDPRMARPLSGRGQGPL